MYLQPSILHQTKLPAPAFLSSEDRFALEKLFKLQLKHRSFNGFFKLAISLLLLWAIYHQVFAKENLGALWNAFAARFSLSNAVYLWVAIALVPVNWLLETLKWRQLLRHFSDMSFWQCYRAVLVGVTVAMLTPNRTGEYIGRILFAEPKNGWRAVIVAMLGGFAQLFILFSCGMIGLCYLAYNYLHFEAYLIWCANTIGGIGLMLSAVFYFRLDLVFFLIQKIPTTKWRWRVSRQFVVLRRCSRKDLTKVLELAAMRYGTYSLQYWLMLLFVGIDVPFDAALAGIAAIFLIQTCLPLPVAASLMVRGELALLVWGYFSQNHIGILAAAFGLFIINIVLPALLGAMFIVKSKSFKIIRL